MRMIAIVLLVFSGAFAVLALLNFQKASDRSLGTFLGTFVIPFLLGWWGKIALERASKGSGTNGSPTPDTHVRCPDCRELVFKDARVCKHCNATLEPQKP